MARVSFEAWRDFVDVRLRCRLGPDEVEGVLQGPGQVAPGVGAARVWLLRVSPTDTREIRPEDGWDVEPLDGRNAVPSPPA